MSRMDMEKLESIVENTLIQDETGPGVYKPLCLAILSRVGDACKNISFSNDITYSDTELFDFDFSYITDKNYGGLRGIDLMSDMIENIAKTLTDFFKDKVATIHCCNIFCFDHDMKLYKVRVDYTES